MEIQRISPQEYESIFANPYHIFNGVKFSELNRDKCNDLHYLIFKDSKIKSGIILGEREEYLLSPFSAPFGGLSVNKAQSVASYESAISCLKDYGNQNNKKIKISLPPYFYNDIHIAKTFSALIRNNAKLLYTDLNYQYSVNNFAKFEECLERSARKNFHNSQKYNFNFIKLDTANGQDIERAYTVIKKNRESRGFPLRMSLQAVTDTVKTIKADFFVMTYEGNDVAAAQVFHVADGINQVIYWGDIPEFAHLRVMNFFTYKVFEYYYNEGLQVLDIGPSTENGIPNYGLCEFKENIGCGISLKFTFEL